MTAHAGNAFPRHAHQPASHQLQGAPLGIEGLERYRQIGGNGEASRTVLLDRGRAEHAFDVPAAVDPNRVVPAALVVGVVIGEDAQVLDCAPRHAAQPWSAVDVGDVYHGGLAVRPDAVGNHGRGRPRFQRDRFEQGRAFDLCDQRLVVEDVNQVDAPQGARRGFHRNEEVLVRQRIRMRHERGKLFLVGHGVGAVAHVCNHRFAVARHELHEARFFRRQAVRHDIQLAAFAPPLFRVGPEAEGVFAGEAWIEQGQAAALADVVMAAENADHPARVTGDRFGKEEGGGEERVASVVGQLPAAVGVHGEKAAREVVRNVTVFPAQVQDTPVVQHGGMNVTVLVESQLAQRLRVLVEKVQVGGWRLAAHAGQAHVGCRGAQNQLVVWQVAGSEKIHIGIVGRRQLLQPRAASSESSRRVTADFADRPAAALAARGEQDARSVKREVQVAYDAPGPRFVHALEAWRAAQFGEHCDFVVPARARDVCLGDKVLWNKTQFAAENGARFAGGKEAAYNEHLVYVEQRVGQQDASLESEDLIACT